VAKKERKPAKRASPGKPAENATTDVSGFCRPHFITISLADKVGAAIEQIRRSAHPDNIFYLYVINERHELCGIVSIRSLLLADNETPVSRVYSPKVVALEERSPVQQAYQTFAHSRFLSLPVIDSHRHILGVVHAHEIAGDSSLTAKQAISEDRTRSQLFELLGIKAEDGQHGPLRIALGRLPWLLVNISGGALCAALLHWLGGRLSNPVEVLALVPVLLVISESIGMQSASLAIANLHRTSQTADARIFLRECTIALALGIACAACLGGALFLWRGSAVAAMTIGLTVIGGCLLVSIVGNAVPFLFHRWRIDPRIAAGPVVLSLSDFLTLLVYLAIVKALAA
jgi:magnesium transporter